MTNTQSDAKGKPVEFKFKIYGEEFGYRVVWDADFNGQMDAGPYHVIEKSAYQEELKLRLDLEDHLAKVQTSSCDEIAKLTYELNTSMAEVERLKTEEANRCEEFAEALGEIGIDVSCCYDFPDLIGRISSLVHETEVEKQSALLDVAVAALEYYSLTWDVGAKAKDALAKIAGRGK